MQKKMTTKKIRQFKLKEEKRYLQMLTCYDFQTAQMLSETDVDIVFVGDSLSTLLIAFCEMASLCCSGVISG